MIKHKHTNSGVCVFWCTLCEHWSGSETRCQLEPLMPPHLPHIHREGDKTVYVVADDYPKVILDG